MFDSQELELLIKHFIHFIHKQHVPLPSWELTNISHPSPHFWVDDFPAFPFDGSHVIVPWRLQQLNVAAAES